MASPLVLVTTLLSFLSLIQPSLGGPFRLSREQALAFLDLESRRGHGAAQAPEKAMEKRQQPGNRVCSVDMWLAALQAVSEDAVPFCSSFISVPLLTVTATATAKTWVTHSQANDLTLLSSCTAQWQRLRSA